jgi:cell division protein FtsB
MQLQMDEMRAIYRNKLIQFTTENAKPGDKPLRMGYDLNAREELIRTYTEKEIDLNERIARENKQSRQLKQEVQALRSYARNLRYLAEDWAPVGVPLPDVLNKDPAYLYGADEKYGSLQEEHHAEIERLRSRNKKLENEVRVL